MAQIDAPDALYTGARARVIDLATVVIFDRAYDEQASYTDLEGGRFVHNLAGDVFVASLGGRAIVVRPDPSCECLGYRKAPK